MNWWAIVTGPSGTEDENHKEKSFIAPTSLSVGSEGIPIICLAPKRGRVLAKSNGLSYKPAVAFSRSP